MTAEFIAPDGVYGGGAVGGAALEGGGGGGFLNGAPLSEALLSFDVDRLIPPPCRFCCTIFAISQSTLSRTRGSYLHTEMMRFVIFRFSMSLHASVRCSSYPDAIADPGILEISY